MDLCTWNYKSLWHCAQWSKPTRLFPPPRCIPIAIYHSWNSWDRWESNDLTPHHHHPYAPLYIWFVLTMGPTTWTAHIKWTHEAYRRATTWHPLILVLIVQHVTVLPSKKTLHSGSTSSMKLVLHPLEQICIDDRPWSHPPRNGLDT